MRYERMLPINKTYFPFTVDMLFYLTFFFITLMFVYLQKLLHCLIIYSYKTNPSFSPCPWNLRSIGPSDFKWLVSKELLITKDGHWDIKEWRIGPDGLMFLAYTGNTKRIFYNIHVLHALRFYFGHPVNCLFMQNLDSLPLNCVDFLKN